MPPWFTVIGWIFCFVISTSSGVVTVFYSIQWGAKASNQWLASVLISVFEDIICMEPLFIIISTLMTSLMEQELETSKITENKPYDLLVFHKAEFKNFRQPNEKEILTAQQSERERRKVRHFLVELIIYVIFVVFLASVCYVDRTLVTYHHRRSLKDLFAGFEQVNCWLALVSFFSFSLIFFFAQLP